MIILKDFKSILEKMKNERDSQINIIDKDIQKLQEQKIFHYKRDLIKEIYEEYGVVDDNISLQEFRASIHLLKL